MKLELHATSGEVMRGVEALQAFAQEKGVPGKMIFGLALALEECASNIVNHAYQRDAQQIFHLALDHREDRFVVELRDHGPAYDPRQTAAPDLDADPDEREAGGLGIHLVRHYTDELQYAREGDENILRMIKLLPPA